MFDLGRDFDRFRVEAEQTIALNPNNELWLAYMGLRFCTIDECDRGAGKLAGFLVGAGVWLKSYCQKLWTGVRRRGPELTLHP